MIPPGHIPALSDLDDIPIHRESVGGMGMNTVSFSNYAFKPYVYRGIGTDLYETKAWLVAEAERVEREHWEAERKAARLRVQRQRREAREARQREQSEREEARQINSIPNLIAQMQAGIERALARAEHREVEQVSVARRQRARERRLNPRPAPGWQPMTGADIDALLDELT